METGRKAKAGSPNNCCGNYRGVRFLERAMGIEQRQSAQIRRYCPLFSSIGVKWSEVGHLAATSCQIIGFAVFCPVKQMALVAGGVNDPGITGRQA